jgi:hypothetical protein
VNRCEACSNRRSVSSHLVPRSYGTYIYISTKRRFRQRLHRQCLDNAVEARINVPFAGIPSIWPGSPLAGSADSRVDTCADSKKATSSLLLHAKTGRTGTVCNVTSYLRLWHVLCSGRNWSLLVGLQASAQYELPTLGQDGIT